MTTGTATILSIGSKSMDEQHSSSVRDEIQAQLDSAQIKQSQMARESGLTAPVLSGWLKDRYQGDNHAVEAKLRRWLVARSRKA